MKVSMVVFISLLVDGTVGVLGLGERMEISWGTTGMQYHVMFLKKLTIYTTAVMTKVNIVLVMVMVDTMLESMVVATMETAIVMDMEVTVAMDQVTVVDTEVMEDMVVMVMVVTVMVVTGMVVEEEAIEMTLLKQCLANPFYPKTQCLINLIIFIHEICDDH